MGVIRNVNNISHPFGNSIDDVLDELIEEVFHHQQQQQEESRRSRRIKQRTFKVQAVGGINVAHSKSGKKKKRIENSNYLLSLADVEEAKEISIHDFIPDTVSVFSQLLQEREKMEMWNEFINCSDDSDWFKSNHPEVGESRESSYDESTTNSADTCADNRNRHPAFSAAECFQKIDSGLRCMLRKKHVPLGTLNYLEDDLITFFTSRPQSVYDSHFSNSFERLLIHALSQYMDLDSLSYDKSGARWTRVRNNYPDFRPPSMPLSHFLGEKLHRNM